MARPRTPIGTFGDIDFTTLGPGRVRARTRVRDFDGQVRRVNCIGELVEPCQIPRMAEPRTNESAQTVQGDIEKLGGTIDHTAERGSVALERLPPPRTKE